MEHENSYKFFENKDCEYYPCHKCEHINCLFCCCPLYFGDSPGTYKILENGVKDCSDCTYPHEPQNYIEVIRRLMRMCHEKAGTWK